MSESRLFGGLSMTALLLAAVAAASLPMVVALAVTSLLPGIGDLNDGVNGWWLLHLLWIYPVLFITASMGEGIAKVISVRAPRTAAIVVEAVIFLLVTTLLCSLYFEQVGGAFICAVVASLLWIPFVKFLQRKAAKQSGSPEDRPVPGT